MFKQISLLFFISNLAHAGGMVGGGELKYKPLMKCDNEVGVSVREVWVVKETNSQGKVLDDAELRVATIDENRKAIDWFVTQERELFVSPDGAINIPIWRYGSGSGNNEIIGAFGWDENSKLGSVYVAREGVDLSISLVNCKMVGQKRKR